MATTERRSAEPAPTDEAGDDTRSHARTLDGSRPHRLVDDGPVDPADDRTTVTTHWRLRAVGDLHTMLLTTVAVDDLLDAVVAQAAERAGSETSATITLRHGQDATVAAATDGPSGACDDAEQRTGVGPCLDAARSGHRIEVPDIATTDRWPDWQRTALDGGFGAAAALPASVPAGPDIDLALNLYRPEPGRWPEAVLDDIARYAEDAARALALAQRSAHLVRTNADLQRAMSSRAVIDQALGVVMAQNRCDADHAFEILRQASQHRNQKLRDVATAVVASVAGDGASSARGFRERART